MSDFHVMQSPETPSDTHGCRKYQRSRFVPVKDSRNRKVRGLWQWGAKWYLQTRVHGEKSGKADSFPQITPILLE